MLSLFLTIKEWWDLRFALAPPALWSDTPQPEGLGKGNGRCQGGRIEGGRWQHEGVNLFSCDAEFEFGQLVRTFPGGSPLHLTLKQNTPAFPSDLNCILIWGSVFSEWILSRHANDTGEVCKEVLEGVYIECLSINPFPGLRTAHFSVLSSLCSVFVWFEDSNSTEVHWVYK